MSKGFNLEGVPANHGNFPSLNPVGASTPSTTVAGSIDQIITSMKVLGKQFKFDNYTSPNGGLMGLILHSEIILSERLYDYVSDPSSYTENQDLAKQVNLCRIHIPEITGTFPDFFYKDYLSLKEKKGSKKPEDQPTIKALNEIERKIKRYPIAFTTEKMPGILDGSFCRVYFKDKNNLSVGVINKVFHRTVS